MKTKPTYAPYGFILGVFTLMAMVSPAWASNDDTVDCDKAYSTYAMEYCAAQERGCY